MLQQSTCFILFSALKILTEDGAVKIFVKLLKEYVESMDYEHQCETDVKKGIIFLVIV